MKHVWRKQEKEIFLPKKPTIIDLKPTLYISLEGIGNPNDAAFSKDIEALYALSYTLKMKCKHIKDYYDYTVYPLEAFWSLTDEGIKQYQEGHDVQTIKQHFKYKAMIKQPEFLTEDLFVDLIGLAYQKKKNERILALKREYIDEGLNCQSLHVGPYKDEPFTFEQMEDYCQKNGYTRVSKKHKEVYISDPRKVSDDKLKTTLRFSIKKDCD